ncbi:MAG: mechanosensitive ion channel [Candidatus Competibacteraceae bacterium]
MIDSLHRGSLMLALLLGLLPAGAVPAQETQSIAPLPLDPAKTAERQQAHRRTLAEEQAETERWRQELQTWSAELPAKLQALQVGQVTDTVLEKSRLDTNVMQLQRDDLQASIDSTQRQIQTKGQTLKELEAQEQLLLNPANKNNNIEGANRAAQLEQTRQILAQVRTELELAKQSLTNFQDRLALVNQSLSLAQQWQSRVEEVFRLQQEQNRLEAQQDLAVRLEKEQQAQLDKAAELRNRLQREGERLSEAQRLLLETSVRAAEEKAKLLRLEGALSQSDDELAGWEGLAAKTDVDPKTLQEGLKKLGIMRTGLQDGETLLQRRIELFAQQKQAIDRREGLTTIDNRLRTEESNLVDGLLVESNKYLERLQQRQSKVAAIQQRLETVYKDRLSQDLLAWEGPPTGDAEWQSLLDGLLGAPGVLLHQIRLSLKSVGNALQQAGTRQWVNLVALEVGLMLVLVWSWRYLQRRLAKAEHGHSDSFLLKVGRLLAKLLRRNGVGLVLAALLLPALWLLQIPQPGLGIIATLVLLAVGIKLPIDLAWQLLASPKLPDQARRPQLYRQVFWTLLIGSLLSALIILAHLSALPKAVTGVFDRLFMLYWLLVLVRLLRVRRFVLGVLAERYPERHFRLLNLRLFSLLLPLPLLAASLLGLVGYLNLAWSVVWHLLIFAGVLMVWVIARGLLRDLVVLLKNYAVTHSEYGLLWTQDIIKPLHNILNLILIAGAWITLFALYGSYGDVTLLADLRALLERPLFSVGGAGINLWLILVTLATLLGVIWLGQWSRTITYRWVFSRITDLGIRHSLSVFAQYLIVLLGVLLVLRMLGLDLTTLTVFAGAVGVGIGFGMQTIANNFISGLMLLVERPLRSGDIVQIGSYNGEITRIGMRSLILQTWDRQEVIIPNSEVITNAFINWTHSDNIMRTVLTIGVGYNTDPHQVQGLLEQVLESHPDVLDEPEWTVLLWDFAESAIQFRLQYYTDLRESSMLKVRAGILLMIWDSFKQAGIEIPYPQRDLHLKGWPPGLEVALPAPAAAISLPLKVKG